MDAIRWTEAQEKAIHVVGRDVLVSASAGTGKTAVLAQRCLARLCEPPQQTDVDRLLVLTYTDAAAEEMHSRIASTLRQSYRRSPSSHLRRQLLLLDAAWISTFHAFCKRLLAEHFYLLNLDANFAIVDPDQQELLKSDAVVQTLEEAWSEPVLAQGISILLTGQSLYGAKGFSRQILALAGFLESIPQPQRFFERMEEFCAQGPPSADWHRLRREQLQRVCEILRQARQKIDYARLLHDSLGLGGWLAQTFDAYQETAERLEQTAHRQDWQTLYQQLQSLELKRFPNRPKDLDEQTADFVKQPLKEVKSDWQDLLNLAALNPVSVQLEGESVQLQMRTVLALLKRFEDNYGRMKRRIGALDFSDLEQMTVSLLLEQPQIAEKLRQRFDYIFVDEFQDINAVQKCILDAIRRPDNVFAVGDVKQSIYAFRRSRPELFLEALSAAQEEPQDPLTAQRLDLGVNFRSRPEILTFANTVFRRIMTCQTASMDYDRRAELVCGRSDAAALAEEEPLPVELVLLDEESDERAEDDQNEETSEQQADSGESALPPAETLSPVQRQALWIAQRLRRMVGADTGKAEFQIFDKEAGCRRDVQYRDIVILMRSVVYRANIYAEILRLAGVPVVSQTASGYFAATEIADLLALLKVLDNPIRDIELAAVLRSALFSFTDSQLARIRLPADAAEPKPASFYEALLAAARRTDDPLAAKVRQALEQLTQWRRAIRLGSLSDVLGAILDQTGYLAFVSALPNGRQRRANLLKLHQRAVQFEHFSTGPQAVSLARFVEFLEKMGQEEQDWAPAQADSASENAVRLFSVHRSKGLEFPVVVLAELNTHWNLQDLDQLCLADEDTLGLRAVDPQRQIRFPTLPWQVLRERKRKTALEEEMRILYVALTRAREKLVVTAGRGRSHCSRIVRECSLPAGHPLPSWKLLNVSRPIDWLLYGLGEEPPMREVFLDGPAAGPTFFTVECVDSRRPQECCRVIEETARRRQTPAVPSLTPDIVRQYQPLIDTCRQTLQWVYPFEEAARLPAKLSVSQAVRAIDEFAFIDTEESLHCQPSVILDKVGRKPSASAAQIGAATHLLLARIDLKQKPNRKALESLAETLVSDGSISPQAARQADFDAILWFFESELGRLVLRYPDNVHREWPFTVSVSAQQAGIASSDEKIIIQGIVDLLIHTKERLILIDFKTDAVSEEEIAERAARYVPQIRYYALAVEKILGRPVEQACLYFLKPSKSFPIDLPS